MLEEVGRSLKMLEEVGRGWKKFEEFQGFRKSFRVLGTGFRVSGFQEGVSGRSFRVSGFQEGVSGKKVLRSGKGLVKDNRSQSEAAGEGYGFLPAEVMADLLGAGNR